MSCAELSIGGFLSTLLVTGGQVIEDSTIDSQEKHKWIHLGIPTR